LFPAQAWTVMFVYYAELYCYISDRRLSRLSVCLSVCVCFISTVAVAYLLQELINVGRTLTPASICPKIANSVSSFLKSICLRLQNVTVLLKVYVLSWISDADLLYIRKISCTKLEGTHRV